MKLLLRQVSIADRHSPYNGQLKDILIIDGIILSIENNIAGNEDIKVIEGEGNIVSPGWVDIFAHFNDPGTEHIETLETGAKAAAAGGFTHVFIVPNTQPAVQSKSVVEYIVQKSKSLPVNIHPLGAISKNIEGKELAEMYDMYNSGAIAFSDGISPVQTPGLLLKALQYIKATNSVLVQLPVDKSISKFGLMNEGITSTQLGLPGIPAMAEELIIMRDIELARYTQSKIHFTGISTAKSIELISKAKEDGLGVTCSVTPYHLWFCDEDLVSYDTNLKLDPPLRSRNDMMALRTAVKEGRIDCIASHHFPQNIDNKNCEFEYAKPGMTGLETSFSVFNTLFPDLETTELTAMLGNNAREIFSLPVGKIKENETADITIFNREKPCTYASKDLKSKSSNSAFLNKNLIGKVLGIIRKEQLYLNH